MATHPKSMISFGGKMGGISWRMGILLVIILEAVSKFTFVSCYK
jgi:hypothetical protein